MGLAPQPRQANGNQRTLRPARSGQQLAGLFRRRAKPQQTDKVMASPGKPRPIVGLGGMRKAIQTAPKMQCMLPKGSCQPACHHKPGVFQCFSPPSPAGGSKKRLRIIPHASLGEIQGQLLNMIPPDCARHQWWSGDMGFCRLMLNWLGSPFSSRPTEQTLRGKHGWGICWEGCLQHSHWLEKSRTIAGQLPHSNAERQLGRACLQDYLVAAAAAQGEEEWARDGQECTGRVLQGHRSGGPPGGPGWCWDETCPRSHQEPPYLLCPVAAPIPDVSNHRSPHAGTSGHPSHHHLCLGVTSPCPDPDPSAVSG